MRKILLRIFTAYFIVYREVYYAYHGAREKVLGLGWHDG
jgi:hypothetical protein